MSSCSDWSALARDNERLISREEVASYLRTMISALSAGELSPPDASQAGAALVAAPAAGLAAGAIAAA